MNVISATHSWTSDGRLRQKASTPWVVIHDPSGDFLGRRFRGADLDKTVEAHWEDGTIFWHAARGEVRIWRGGTYRTLTPRRSK
ncbi:MAG: hypothetical protein ACOYYI_01675 [Chloroflexota bacterium]